MDRKQYLELCQKQSVEGNSQVLFKDICYWPMGYLLSFNKKGNAIHTGVLQDIKSNCIVYAPMDKIEEAIN